MSQVNRQPAQYSRESVVAILELRGDRVTADRQSDDKRGLALHSSLLNPPLLFMRPALPILDCRPRSSTMARGCKTFMGKVLNGILSVIELDYFPLQSIQCMVLKPEESTASHL